MATTFRDADRPRTCKLAQRCTGTREPVGKPGRRLIGRWPNQSQRLKRAVRADRFSQRNFEILWMVFCGSGGLFCFLAGCWSLGRLRMPNAPLIDWLMQRPSPGSANFTKLCVLSDLGRAGAHLRTRHHVHLKTPSNFLISCHSRSLHLPSTHPPVHHPLLSLIVLFVYLYSRLSFSGYHTLLCIVDVLCFGFRLHPRLHIRVLTTTPRPARTSFSSTPFLSSGCLATRNNSTAAGQQPSIAPSHENAAA